jgi:alkanesulfonate monooxygenase SsuD/methylene tetrahydromethanopterin reductase-like flavin-dependent oxidoreductase (luciferase family)
MGLNARERVTWSGRFRPPLDNAEIAPRPEQGTLPVFVGLGGTLESALRAGRLGLPIVLANISQKPAKLAPQIAAYRETAASAGHDPGKLTVGIASHLHVARESQAARAAFLPHYSTYFQSHAPKVAYANAVPEEVFKERLAPDGPLFVGSPQEIVDKIGRGHALFGHQRFIAHADLGGLSFASVARVIELLATEVLPQVRDL